MCPECHRPLPVRVRSQGRSRKYCSTRCGHAARWRMNHPRHEQQMSQSTRALRGRALVAEIPAGTQRECPSCGRNFLADSRRRRCCSRSCAASWRNGHHLLGRACELPWRECPCGKSFYSRTRRRYCSETCTPDRYPAIYSRICSVCGVIFMRKTPRRAVVGRSLIFCGDHCRNRHRWQTRPSIPQSIRQRVFARDAWTCYLCLLPIDRSRQWPHPMSPSVDHVKPRSAGGSDDPSNLRATHWHCNEEKGDRLLGEEMWEPAA